MFYTELAKTGVLSDLYMYTIRPVHQSCNRTHLSSALYIQDIQLTSIGTKINSSIIDNDGSWLLAVIKVTIYDMENNTNNHDQKDNRGKDDGQTKQANKGAGLDRNRPTTN